MEDAQRHGKELTAELSLVRSDDLVFEVKEGQSNVVAGLVPIGLQDASYSKECEVTVNNINKKLRPGEYVIVELPGRSCRAILQECNYSGDSARFRWLCTKK